MDHTGLIIKRKLMSGAQTLDLDSTIAVEPQGNAMTTICYYGVGASIEALTPTFAAAILKDFETMGRPARIWHDSKGWRGAVRAQWSQDWLRYRELQAPVDEPGVAMLEISTIQRVAGRTAES